METGCAKAREYDVASVCIKPYYLARCANILAGSSVLPSTVIGFPHGGHPTTVKLAELEQAIADGGIELDVVANIGKVRSEDWDYVEAELAQLIGRIREEPRLLVKVIFENCYLRDEHKMRLCEICSAHGADFVKTSTGFGNGGATLDDCQLMRAHCPDTVQIKASGGIKTLDDVLAFRDLGVTRCGSSNTFSILEDCKGRLGG